MRAVAQVVLLVAAAGCFIPRESATSQADRACGHCHGDADRPGDAAAKAAPPFDIFGNTETFYPGVGAHQLHLTRSESHAAIACTECHRVPQTARDEGHNVGRTTFAFGPLARGDAGVTPTYDFGTRRCANACHGARSGSWTNPRTSAEACGSCHGRPPPAPHPQAGGCDVCHSEVINAAGAIIAADLHVNGSVQLSNVSCNACHGRDSTGAPPSDLDGGSDRSSTGVGVHTAHLSGGRFGKAVACTTCHLVPASVATPTHPNGGRAEVLTAVGWSQARNTCTTGCHGGTSPEWTTLDAGIGCSSCHGAPPPAPHPQASSCGLCHQTFAGNAPLASERQRHGDGTLDVNVPSTCDGCHGSNGNPAPPRDTQGQTATTAPGVGAHQAHLVGRGLARQVTCNECHVVPTAVVTPSHTNGVTEVRFTGISIVNTIASYQTGRCTVACHDVSTIVSAPGGGTTTTPQWTLVNGSQATCTSCHGMPPPAPHVQRADCESCHRNATAQHTFVRPELHVDGRLNL